MQRLYLLLSIFIVAAILAGCAPKADVEQGEAKALENTVSTEPQEHAAIDPIESPQVEVVPDEPPADCPMTQAPEASFVPPAPYPPEPPERYGDEFWYGTPELWTMLGTEATWSGLPHNRYGYSQKVFWWSQNFDVTADPFPLLTVIIERLGADAPSAPLAVTDEATNASADFGTAMLTGVDLPSLGCWKITGQFQKAELSFVVWVAP